MEKIKVGDDVFSENELKRVTDIILNNRCEQVIVWKSSRSSGACMPSIWYDWCQAAEL